MINKIKSKRGFSFIELLIALMVVAMVSTLVTTLLLFGLQTFGTSTKQIAQHDVVMDVTQRIRNDIELAASCGYKNTLTESVLKLTFPDPLAVPDREWKFYDSKLYLNGEEVIHGLNTELEDSTDGDTRISRFQKLDNCIYLSIQPTKTNTTIHLDRNVRKPIITEFSVAYKYVYEIP